MNKRGRDKSKDKPIDKKTEKSKQKDNTREKSSKDVKQKDRMKPAKKEEEESKAMRPGVLSNKKFKDQKIDISFLPADRKSFANSKKKLDEEVSKTRGKRVRDERSSSKKKQKKQESEHSAESEDEEVPKSVSKKTVKVEKKKPTKSKSKSKTSKAAVKESDEETESEKEEKIEEIEVDIPKKGNKKNVKAKKDVKNTKKKGMIEEVDSDEELKPRAKSVPSKGKKGKKKEESDEEGDEADDEEGDESWGKKGNNSGKTSKNSQKTTKTTKNSKKSKSSKPTGKYRRGKENPNVEILSSCKYMDSKEPHIYDDCCIHCNDRNVLRAANTGNTTLLKKCLAANKQISSLSDGWSADYPYTPLDLAVLRGDKPMITELINFLINSDQSNEIRVTKPAHKFGFIDTGEQSVMAYGTRTRQLNMTRGNREGNNAFLVDFNNTWSTSLHRVVLEELKDAKLIDYINAALMDPFKKKDNNNDMVGFNHYVNFDGDLHLAAQVGNRNVCHHLLKNMTKNKNANNFGFNQLHFTVLDSKDDKFEDPHKASVNKKSIGRNVITPVHLACINPNEKILKRLIDLGGDWHFVDFSGRKPIHYAASCEGSGPLRYLLSIGAHADEPDRLKVTPLMIAAKCGREENIKLLLKTGVKVIAKSRTGNMALHEAAKYGHSEIVRMLIEEGNVKVDLPGGNRMTALMVAAQHGHVDTVNTLLELNAGVLKKDKFKRSALLLACKSGHAVIASILLSRGSDFNMPDSSNNSPLHYACAYGWINIVELLLKAGANVNSTNMWKISPLEVAMLKNHFGVVKFLLNNSAVDVNMKFDKGNTLLHHSFLGMTAKSVSEIDYLITEKKADVNIQNMEGVGVLHVLAQFNFDAYLAIFDDRGFNNNMTLSRGRRFNNFNTFNNNFNNNNLNNDGEDEETKNEKKMQQYKEEHKNLIQNVFKVLINNNAFINIRTVKDKTPLQIALETKNIPFIEEMISLTPELEFVDNNGQTVLHLLTEFLFNKEGEDIVFRILMKLSNSKNSENLGKIVNSLDEKGFTPILKLFYKYSFEVENFYKSVLEKETFKVKEKIFEESLKKQEESGKKSMIGRKSKGDYDEDEEEDFGGSEDDEEMKIDEPYSSKMGISREKKQKPSFAKRKTVASSAAWTTSNAVGIEYGITNSEKVSRREKINFIKLTKKDEEKVHETARGVLFDYLSTVFKNIVGYYINLGCNIHGQVQKTKKWRERKPGEEINIEEENDQEEEDNFKTVRGFNRFNNFNHFGGHNRPAKALTSMRAAPRKRAKMTQNIIKNPNNNTINKKKVHDEAIEFFNQLGYCNVLMLLMKFPFAPIIESLIEEFKVDINIVDIYKQNCLLHLIKNYEAIKIIFPDAFSVAIDQMLKYHVKVNQFDRDNNSAFLMLSKHWDLKQLEKLYNYGADVNQINKSGENALIYYIRKKDKTTVNLLLNNFLIDINHRDDKLRTAVHYLYNDEDSSADIDVSLKQIILSKNPDVNAIDISGRTPLHYLFVKINKEFDNNSIDPIVSLSTLLDIKGIEVDVQDIYGNTPLHYASQRGATICAMSLIQKCNINKKNFEGNTCLAYALLFQQPNFSIVLVQQGGDIFETAYMVKERSEDNLIKKKKKAEESSSRRKSMTQIAQVTQVSNTSMLSTVKIKMENVEKEEFDINNGEDEEDNDESDSDNSDDDNENKNSDDDDDFGMMKKPAMKVSKVGYAVKGKFGGGFGGGFGFGSYNNNNFDVDDNNSNTSAVTSHKQLNNKYFITKEDKDRGISLFRICVKNGYQGLTYLFVNAGYDLMKAIQDSFYENKFNLAMLLLDKSPYDDIYRKINDKGQNLFHILAIHGKSVNNKNDLDLFFEKMSEKGIPQDQQDMYGFIPLHYACENHFKELVEYILKKGDPGSLLAVQSKSGFTPFICAIKGENCKKSLQYINLLIQYIAKKQISLAYLEESYGVGYKCTPVIHFTRTYLGLPKANKMDPVFSEEGKAMIEMIKYGANVMERDSNGMDCLMHCVKENNSKLLELFYKNCKKEIVFESVDNNGRGLVHYAVCPTEEGSYENEYLLGYILEKGFKSDIKDKFNKTPYDYACEQKSGVNLRILKKYKACPESLTVLRRQNSVISTTDWPISRFKFEQDADALYQSMASVIGKREEVLILPDENGHFPADTHTLLKDDTNGYWDVTMTKVKVGSGLYGEYNFYKMQVIHDKGRDIYILWNRFGRIGEIGQSQRTPFNAIEDAQAEFKKIFKEKSGNEWENKSSFNRVKGKYMLLHFKESKLSHKDLLENFDFKKCPESTIPEKEVRSLVKELTNSAIYFKALNDSGIDQELLNFNYLNKSLIVKARGILGEITKLQNEIAALRLKKNSSGGHDDEVVNKVLEYKSQIYELSSRYYEVIPKARFKNMPVSPLDNDNQIKEEIMLLENLTYVENAVKILLAAQMRQKEVNPIDYCLNSMGVLIQTIKHESTEFSLLKKYITQNSSEKMDRILNIFRIQRKGEGENIQKWETVPNHMLLFHGSKIFNYLGILSSGLKIAPPEAPATGYMFGKGVYFADMFDKSYAYCDSWDFEDEKGKKKTHKYMLMCEVALGNIYTASRTNPFDPELGFLKNGFHSLKAQSSQGPDLSCKFVMNNGVEIPLGKAVPYENEKDYDQAAYLTNYPEYVAYDSSQIRMRYLIQIENDMDKPLY